MGIYLGDLLGLISYFDPHIQFIAYYVLCTLLPAIGSPFISARKASSMFDLQNRCFWFTICTSEDISLAQSQSLQQIFSCRLSLCGVQIARGIYRRFTIPHDRDSCFSFFLSNNRDACCQAQARETQTNKCMSREAEHAATSDYQQQQATVRTMRAAHAHA